MDFCNPFCNAFCNQFCNAFCNPFCNAFFKALFSSFINKICKAVLQRIFQCVFQCNSQSILNSFWSRCCNAFFIFHHASQALWNCITMNFIVQEWPHWVKCDILLLNRKFKWTLRQRGKCQVNPLFSLVILLLSVDTLRGWFSGLVFYQTSYYKIVIL